MTKFTEILPKAIQLNSVSVIESFLNSFDTVLTDCDGVLWNESEPIQGSPEAINLLRRLGKKVVYVTNNSGHTRAGYVQKCKELGFDADIQIKDIFTPAFVCAQYLKRIQFKEKVCLFGPLWKEEPPVEEFQQAGIASTWRESIEGLKEDKIGALVMMFGWKKMPPSEISEARGYLKNQNILFLNCADPKPNIQEHFERTPLQIGKPGEKMFESVCEVHDINPARTIMIGDTGKTDMIFGKTNCVRTLLVGSGSNTLDDVGQWIESGEDCKVPDFYSPSLGALVPYLKEKS